jgi:hypothetical protein
VNLSNDSFILYAAVDVQPGASGAPPVVALANPYGLPMEILEVRFQIFPRVKSSDAEYTRIVGQGVNVKFDLGKASVADDKTPISIFGSIVDTYEYGPSMYAFDDVSVSSGVNQIVRAFTYGWRLKYPLYVPVGGVLTPKFTSNITAYPVHVDIAYVCRTVQQKPAGSKVMVPWVASYNSKAFTVITNGAADSDVSNQLDLVNPFSVPLELARIGGRAMFLQNSNNDYDNVQNYISNELLNLRNRLTTLRLRSSRGDDIVRGPVPFDLIFPANWYVWDLPGKWQLAPGEFYTATLETLPIDYNTATEYDTDSEAGRVQFSIGLIGYRPVSVESLVGEAA